MELRDAGRESKKNNSFYFQAEDDIRDLVRSRGLGDVYTTQMSMRAKHECSSSMYFILDSILIISASELLISLMLSNFGYLKIQAVMNWKMRVFIQ